MGVDHLLPPRSGPAVRSTPIRFLEVLALLAGLHLLLSILLPRRLGELWMPLFWLPGARHHAPEMALALGSSVLVGVLLSLPVWLVAEAIRTSREDERRGRGLCPQCGYDVRATPGRCPECGATFPPGGSAE